MRFCEAQGERGNGKVRERHVSLVQGGGGGGNFMFVVVSVVFCEVKRRSTYLFFSVDLVLQDGRKGR